MESGEGRYLRQARRAVRLLEEETPYTTVFTAARVLGNAELRTFS